MQSRGILLPLVVLWLVGPALSALLLWIEMRRTGKLVLRRPLVAIAAVVVPIVTLAATVALFVMAIRERS